LLSDLRRLDTRQAIRYRRPFKSEDELLEWALRCRCHALLVFINTVSNYAVAEGFVGAQTQLHTQTGFTRLGRWFVRYVDNGGDLLTLLDRAAWINQNGDSGREASSLGRLFNNREWEGVEVTGLWDTIYGEVVDIMRLEEGEAADKRLEEVADV
jgi:hypothetical protein